MYKRVQDRERERARVFIMRWFVPLGAVKVINSFAPLTRFPFLPPHPLPVIQGDYIYFLSARMPSATGQPLPLPLLLLQKNEQ